MAAVAHVRQFHRHGVVVVAFAEAQRRQRDAALALLRDARLECLGVHGAHVEVAVGGEDHAVHTALDEALRGLRIGQVDACRAIGGTAGVEGVDRGEDLRVLVTRRGAQGDTGGASVGHQRHAILRAQLGHDLAQRRLEQGQLVRRIHRARHVDEEDQVGGGDLVGWHLVSLDAHQQQVAVGVPRRGSQFGGDAEGLRAIRGRRVPVVEIVDEFLAAHGVGRRQFALLKQVAHVGVGAGVDIDAEGRDRIGRGQVHRIGIAMTVGAGVDRCGRHHVSHAGRRGCGGERRDDRRGGLRGFDQGRGLGGQRRRRRGGRGHGGRRHGAISHALTTHETRIRAVRRPAIGLAVVRHRRDR